MYIICFYNLYMLIVYLLNVDLKREHFLYSPSRSYNKGIENSLRR